MATKRALEDDWIELTYRLNQDFDGMHEVDRMPLRAYAYLQRTNPSLDMHGSMGKRCTAAFNDLPMSFRSAGSASPAAQWYTSLHAGQWRTVLMNKGIPIEEVLSDAPVKKRARTEAIKLAPHFFVVVGGGCHVYSFDAPDIARRKLVMDTVSAAINEADDDIDMVTLLFDRLCGSADASDIPPEYQEINEVYDAIKPLPSEWSSGYGDINIGLASASTTILKYH